MSGYKKYNGLDYRPKFSSSDRGQARNVHYVLGKIFKPKRRKSVVSIGEMNEIVALFFGIIYLIFWGFYKLVVWLYKSVRKLKLDFRAKTKVATIVTPNDAL